MDALRVRRSVRKFDKTRKIDYDTLLELCRIGEMAPAARNQKGREYVIIDDENIINQLSTVSKGALVLANGVAAIAVIARPKDDMVTPCMLDQDLSCAVENILIGATEMGIGSCYIGIYPHPERIEPCDKVLNVSDGKHTFALIALGYPSDENAFYEKDKLTEDMIYHNRY